MTTVKRDRKQQNLWKSGVTVGGTNILSKENRKSLISLNGRTMAKGSYTMPESNTITYFSHLEGDLHRNPSFPLINENNFTLLKTGKRGFLRGPRRVLRLCIFALLVPAALIAIPLYVKLVLYPPGHYPMMPTDQRLLNHHVSGVWCQAQTTHMNGSFNTYMSQGYPGIGKERRRHVMLHTMKMRDDVKEYWGFHFLKGSTITISSCARWDGGQLMVLRGIENLRRCAWIGEEDSAEDMLEDDDAISEERFRIRDKLMREEAQGHNNPSDKNQKGEQKSYEAGNLSEERRKSIAQLLREAIKMSKDKKEILKILHSEGKEFNRAGSSRVKHIDDELSQHEKAPSNKSSTIDHESMNLTTTSSSTVSSRLDTNNGTLKSAVRKRTRLQAQKDKRKKLRQTRRKWKKKEERRRVENLTEEDLPAEEAKTLSRLKRFAEDDDSGGAFEEIDAQDILDILTDPKKDKKVNVSSVEMTVGHRILYPEGLKFERGSFNQTTANDRSREEHVSSYSSSEEALASCEGVIFTLPLVPFRNCHFDSMGLNKITYDIPISGTYYFVFSSDNEIYDNDLFFNLTMDRVVYDIFSSESICTNTTECSVPLSFWSDEQAVVEVPEERTWEHAYVLDTKCEPRVYVYITLLLLVPIFIMCCALH